MAPRKPGLPVMAASGLSAMMATAVVQPLDVLKSRKQVRSGEASKGEQSEARPRLIDPQLYRGVMANVLTSGISWSIFQWSFEGSRGSSAVTSVASTLRSCRSSRRCRSQGPNARPADTFLETLIASSLAGSFSTFVSHPLFLVKTRMELRQRGDTRGWLGCAKAIYDEGGFPAFFTGIGPSLALVPHGAIQMLLYQKLKNMNAKPSVKDGANQKSGDRPPSPDSGKAAAFLYGAVSKLAATSLTYPLQVLRARQQAPNSNLRGTNFGRLAVQALANPGGFRSLYSGLGLQLQRSCLHSGLMFLLFENLRAAPK